MKDEDILLLHGSGAEGGIVLPSGDVIGARRLDGVTISAPVKGALEAWRTRNGAVVVYNDGCLSQDAVFLDA